MQRDESFGRSLACPRLRLPATFSNGMRFWPGLPLAHFRLHLFSMKSVDFADDSGDGLSKCAVCAEYDYTTMNVVWI